jgi:hypothetical protein
MKVEIIGVGAGETEKGHHGALLVSLGRRRCYTAS